MSISLQVRDFPQDMGLLYHSRNRLLNEFLPAEVDNRPYNKNNQNRRDSMHRQPGRVQIARIMEDMVPQIGTKQIAIMNQINTKRSRCDFIDYR